MLTCFICGMMTSWKIVRIVDETFALCSKHEGADLPLEESKR